MQDLYGFSDDMCFESSDELASRGRLADFIINGTMDQQHVPTSLPLLKQGYDMLLEKPLAVNEEEMFELLDCAREHDSTVLICHVLRYAPFYRKIKDIILSGQIGSVINLQLAEYVSHHHIAVAYIRGKWNNQHPPYIPILLAKSSHDMDLMMWLKDESPQLVSSFGSDYQFRHDRKPEGGGTRCLTDCPLVDTCLYSAKSHYLDHPDRWDFYVWDDLEDIEHPTLEDKRRSLETDNIHGRCMWEAEHDNVDHQVVTVHFADGATGTLNLVGGTAKGDRTLHIVGTRGEIQGAFGDDEFILRTITPSTPTGYTEEVIQAADADDVLAQIGGHGGGDLKVVEDFVNILYGETPSVSATTLEDSVTGHLAVFRAGDAMAATGIQDLTAILEEKDL